MVSLSDKPEDVSYLISVDTNDASMKDIEMQAYHIAENCLVVYGNSTTKMEAINADIEHAHKDWDIVLLASDDMIPQVQGWDEVIRKGFYENEHTLTTEGWNGEGFKVEGSTTLSSRPVPNLDQALWFFDGHQHRICTLVVMGRKRYERFGYLYHPSYISLWCDNEWTEVNQPKKFEQILFKHEHPAWGGQVPMDALYQRNEAYFERDRMNFEKRKREGFPI